MQTFGVLYLLPVGLGECNIEHVLPKRNIELVKKLTFFIAENAKEARAFLKQCQYSEMSKAQLSLINQHTKTDELTSFLAPLLQGNDMGLMSDAGCPGIADPGAEIMEITLILKKLQLQHHQLPFMDTSLKVFNRLFIQLLMLKRLQIDTLAFEPSHNLYLTALLFQSPIQK